MNLTVCLPLGDSPCALWSSLSLLSHWHTCKHINLVSLWWAAPAKDQEPSLGFMTTGRTEQRSRRILHPNWEWSVQWSVPWTPRSQNWRHLHTLTPGWVFTGDEFDSRIQEPCWWQCPLKARLSWYVFVCLYLPSNVTFRSLETNWVFFVWFYFETASYYIDQAKLNILAILLPQTPYLAWWLIVQELKKSNPSNTKYSMCVC